jgi:hypothetical protein
MSRKSYIRNWFSNHTIRNAEDLSVLLDKCGARAVAIFEEKLGLSKRLFRSRRPTHSIA